MKGKVISEVEYNSKMSNFSFQSIDTLKEYKVISFGTKAVKDYLFIRPGYIMDIDGLIDEDNSILLSEVNKIYLNINRLRTDWFICNNVALYMKHDCKRAFWLYSIG